MTDKYGRTYHLPFSPGVTNDDRINKDWFEDVKVMSRILWTEKLDGENTCLSRSGVYARSHAAPTTSPWSKWIRNDWSQKSYDIDEDIEIFGENLLSIVDLKTLSSMSLLSGITLDGCGYLGTKLNFTLNTSDIQQSLS